MNFPNVSSCFYSQQGFIRNGRASRPLQYSFLYRRDAKTAPDFVQCLSMQSSLRPKAGVLQHQICRYPPPLSYQRGSIQTISSEQYHQIQPHPHRGQKRTSTAAGISSRSLYLPYISIHHTTTGTLGSNVWYGGCKGGETDEKRKEPSQPFAMLKPCLP